MNRIARLVDIAGNDSTHHDQSSLTLSFTEKNYLDPPTLLFNLSSEVEEGDWVSLVCNVDGKYRLNLLTKIWIMDKLFEISAAINYNAT